MKIHVDEANRTRVTLHNGNVLFISYETCVAAQVEGGTFRSEKKWSRTTSKCWVNGV